MIERRVLSFKFAFEGIGYVLRSQPNAWIHALITLAVIVMAIWLNVDLGEWAILIITMVIVWVAEMANTAIEAFVDIISPEYRPEAKTVKDVFAGAVLISAIGAAIVGILVLGPPLLERLSKG